jgi:hypothetical protein
MNSARFRFTLFAALFAVPAHGQNTLDVSHRGAQAHFIVQGGSNPINTGENHETNMPGVFDPIAVTGDVSTFASLSSFMGPGLAMADSLVDVTTIQTGTDINVSAFAQTDFDFGFTTTAPMPYTFEIEYEGVAPDAGVTFSLVFSAIGVGELLSLSSADFGPNSEEPTALMASLGGVLPPGNYILNVKATPSHHFAGEGVIEFFPMRYSLSLTLGIPGDVNGDCIVDTADLGSVIAAFGGSSPTEDLNGDGVVDTADLGALLGAFGTTCP